MLMNMNAAEIIQEISHLPEVEQGKVVEFVEALKSAKSVRYIDSGSVEKAADKGFREHAPLLEKLAQ